MYLKFYVFEILTWEKPSAVQILSEMMVMLAVVRVPVLSEQSTFIEAISWSAVKCVTMAFFSAIVDAPIAMVTCGVRMGGPRKRQQGTTKKDA
jgi:hypothetical protein